MGTGDGVVGYSAALALHRSAVESRDPVLTDRSISALRSAVATAPSGSVAEAELLSALGIALRGRYLSTRDRHDLDEAVTCHTRAVATDLESTSLGRRATNLANALISRFELAGDLGDIDAAVDARRRALDAARAPGERARFQSNLAAALGIRFQRTAQKLDLDASIEAGREALALGARDSAQTNLAASLFARFRSAGDPRDLNEAIALHRAALGSVNESADGTRLFNLAVALIARFQLSGNSGDIDEAIDISAAAAEAAAAGDPNLGRRLSTLGVALRTRFDRTQSPEDLDHAIGAHLRALTESADDDPRRGMYWAGLGAAYHTGYEHTGDIAQLGEAISACRNAVNTTPDDHPELPTRLSNLAAALTSRVLAEGEENAQAADAADLAEAQDAHRRALLLTAADHPSRCMRLINLAINLHTRFSRKGDREANAQAIAHFREAAQSSNASAIHRLIAAGRWARAAAADGAGGDALEGYRTAVRLLPRVAARGLRLGDGEGLLDRWSGLAQEAAAHALGLNLPDAALELLEHGRSVLWGQLVEHRSVLDDLREVAPELRDVAAELETHLRIIDAVVEPTADGESGAAHRDAVAKSARRYEELTAHVQSAHPQANFLTAITANELCAAALNGPIVVINVTATRSDALIVGTTGVRSVRLPTLTETAVADHVDRYLLAQQALDDRQRGRLAKAHANHEIITVLRWLWHHITEPVLDELGCGGRPGDSLTRIWWCPTGPLTLMPLHAAGDGTIQDGHCVADRVVSSYTPTVRALLRAQQSSDRDARLAHPRLLVVTMPTTPGFPDLPSAAAEAAMLDDLWPASRRSSLSALSATVQAVLVEAERCSLAHFACHGTQIPEKPSAAGLVLHDGLLTVSHIAQTHRAAGEFVYLSCCHSYSGTTRVPDEGISVAAALHYLGWTHVLATVWTVDDADAAAVAQTVYRYLSSEGNLNTAASAWALHAAVAQLRRAYPHTPARWAPFVHIGP